MSKLMIATKENLIKEIQRAKNLTDLERLDLQGVQEDIFSHYEKKAKVLRRKRYADKLALMDMIGLA